jgi:hypothetical protein
VTLPPGDTDKAVDPPPPNPDAKGSPESASPPSSPQGTGPEAGPKPGPSETAEHPKGSKDSKDELALGPLRPTNPDAVVVRKAPPKHKLPKTSPLFREWNRTGTAFEELTRVKNCEQPSMGVICHRFEDLKKDIEAADSDTPIDSLITRVRYMSESIAAKKAQR